MHSYNLDSTHIGWLYLAQVYRGKGKTHSTHIGWLYPSLKTISVKASNSTHIGWLYQVSLSHASCSFNSTHIGWLYLRATMHHARKGDSTHIGWLYLSQGYPSDFSRYFTFIRWFAPLQKEPRNLKLFLNLLIYIFSVFLCNFSIYIIFKTIILVFQNNYFFN